MRRREMLMCGVLVAAAGCTSNTDQPSDGNDDGDGLEETPGSNNETEPASNETETTEPELDQNSTTEDNSEPEPEDDEKQEDELSAEEEEAREYIDAGRALLNEAVEIYVSVAGVSQTDPAEIGVDPGDFPRSKIINKTFDADNKFDEAADIVDNQGVRDSLATDLKAAREEMDLIRITVRTHSDTIVHYRSITETVSWIESDNSRLVKQSFDTLNEEQTALDDGLVDLNTAYSDAEGYGDEYVTSIGSVPNLLETARNTSSDLEEALRDLWSIIDNELRDAHQAYSNENYNTAMTWADTAARNFEDLADDVEEISVPKGGVEVRDRIHKETNNRLSEARRLREDAAQSADS